MSDASPSGGLVTRALAYRSPRAVIDGSIRLEDGAYIDRETLQESRRRRLATTKRPRLVVAPGFERPWPLAMDALS